MKTNETLNKYGFFLYPLYIIIFVSIILGSHNIIKSGITLFITIINFFIFKNYITSNKPIPSTGFDNIRFLKSLPLSFILIPTAIFTFLVLLTSSTMTYSFIQNEPISYSLTQSLETIVLFINLFISTSMLVSILNKNFSKIEISLSSLISALIILNLPEQCAFTFNGLF